MSILVKRSSVVRGSEATSPALQSSSWLERTNIFVDLHPTTSNVLLTDSFLILHPVLVYINMIQRVVVTCKALM